MDVDSWWRLVADARAGVPDPDDCCAVAERTTSLLSAMPPADIAAYRAPLREVMAAGYRVDLWGAAYRINGGCSDDGFEYFRGWLITQGREVHERALTDPDSLADAPGLIRAVARGEDVECEDMMGAVVIAYKRVTGEYPPRDGTHPYPRLDPFWDFDDDTEIAARLPRLAALLGQ